MICPKKYPQEYNGVQLCNIPSRMGGVFPAARTGSKHEGKEQVICLHPEFWTNWVLTIKEDEISTASFELTPAMKKIINSRKA